MIARPARRVVARLALWLVLPAVARGAAAATTPPLTADDLCAPGANPCVLQRSIALPSDTVLDFGARDVVVTASGALDAGSGTLHLVARSLDVLPRGALLAPGGLIDVTTSGDLTLERSADGTTRARIVVAADGGGGEIDLTAGGTLTVAGALNARGTIPAADGGTIALSADGDVLLGAAAGDVTVAAGSQGTGGQISLRSRTGSVVVQHGLDASGGDDDGGDIVVSAARDVDLDQLDVRGGGTSGSGGSVTVSAGGNVVLAGPILGAAASGGNGAEVDVTAGATLRVAAPIRVPGSAPDGSGGDVDLTGTVVELAAPVLTPGVGIAGWGGDVTVGGAADVEMAALVDVTGGADGRAGSVSVDAPGSVTVDGEIAADGDFGSIEIASGSLLVATGDSHAATAPDGVGGTVDVQGTCDLQIGPDARIAAAGPGAENRLAGGRPMRVAGAITATERNRLLYRDPAFPPVVTGHLLPAPLETVAATLASCGDIGGTTPSSSSTTTSTSATSSSTGVVLPSSSSTSSTVTPTTSSSSTEGTAVTTSEPSSTTSPVSTSSTTTPSTLPPSSCEPSDPCDDGDTCTRDRCVNGACVHDEAHGRAAALCRIVELETILAGAPPDVLPRGPLARRLVRRASAAARLVGGAGTRPGYGRHLRQATRQLAVLEHLVERHEGSTIDRAFGEHLRALASGATVRVTALLGPPA